MIKFRAAGIASIPIPLDGQRLDADQIRQENIQLRELVVQLTEIILRNVVDQNPRNSS